jgi:hypothetical protein
MPVQLKPSAAANTFVKALETYVTSDQEFQMVGFELSLILDPRQHERFMIVWEAYQGGRQARGL